MDPFFDGPHGISVVGEYLNACAARELRILTGIPKPDLDAWMEKSRFAWETSVDVQYRPGLKLKVHDRFALVDDELWHFGSTVGGGYGRLSAASRGWFQFARDFRFLFNDIWSS